MELYFDQRKIPRTIGRVEWKEIDRWRRRTRGILKSNMENKIAMLRNAGLTERMHEDIINEAINPPLMLGPYQ